MIHIELFIITILIEFIIISFWLKDRLHRIFIYITLINALSWPLANLIYYYLIMNFLLVESAVFLVEGILIKHLFDINYSQAFMVSLIINTASALAGYLISLFL